MTTLAQVMVEHPVCAHAWQTIADVRRTMLVSDFSVLPLAGGSNANLQTWRVLTADDLASWLGADDQREDRMGKTVKQAMKCGIAGSLCPNQARIYACPSGLARPGGLERLRNATLALASDVQ